MIVIRGRGATYGEAWYDEEPPGKPGVDIILYLQRHAPIATSRHTPVLSLATDLSLEDGEIMDKFSKDCRYEIRRAETRDGLETEFLRKPEGRLDEFREFYDTFAGQKSVVPSDHRWLVAACESDQLALSSASRNGEVLVWHAYVISANTARLQYSGSCFRNRPSDYRALVGRANRWLHWRDMQRLKELGMLHYDWGGLFADESALERAGINRFKREFGGRQECRYDCTVAATIRGRIWLALRDAWQRGKSVGNLREFVSRQQLPS
jgi:hypothetical protein